MSSSAQVASALGALAPSIRALVQALTQISHQRGLRIYVVGGLVRDALLGRDSRDVDLVVEGAELALDPDLDALRGVTTKRHPAFLTTELQTADGHAVNLAVSRKESYPNPAALPLVKPAPVVEDLWRRDFSVNALAVELGPRGIGPILDPCGGLSDLSARRLRILHADSFVDDPTRAYRGVRFESRLGFELDAFTRKELARALDERAFDALSGSRLVAELDLVFTQLPSPCGALGRCEELGLLSVIDPELRFFPSARACFENLEVLPNRATFAAADRVTVGRLALLGGLLHPIRARIANRLGLSGRAAASLLESPDRIADAAARLSRAVLPHEAARVLTRLAVEEWCLLWASYATVRAWFSTAHEALSKNTLSLQGRDLLAAGVAAGPALGRALAATQDARWDGRIEAEDELRFALEFLGQPEEGGGP